MASASMKSESPAPAHAPSHPHDPIAERRRALRIGKDILGLLEDLHASVRAACAPEQIPADDLADLEEAEACLKNVLGEIQMRAHSELAKLDRSRH